MTPSPGGRSSDRPPAQSNDNKEDIMQNNVIRCLVGPCLAVIVLSTTGGGAPASSFTRECAIRDLQVLMLIEDRQSAGAVDSEDLDDAVFTMLRAQTACHEGRVADALSLYDDISRRISTTDLGFGRRR
jgi:hypothetical protein